MTKSAKRLFSVLICALLMLTAGIISACSEGNVKMTFMDGDSVYETIEAAAGEEITPPADPTSETYNFEGWYLDKECKGEKQTIPTVMPEKDVTYYAGWSEKVASVLTLNAGEYGTLATTEYNLNVGDKVLAALKNITPEIKLTGLSFGGWFNGATQVTEDTTMPEGGMTLTAKYKYQYTVLIYAENAEGDYPAQAEPVMGSSWYKEAFAYEIDKETYSHYVFDEEHAGFNRSTDSLDETNYVFTVYLKRETVIIAYNANSPSADASVTGSIAPHEYPYGADIVLAGNAYSVRGLYRFAGWARTPGGIAEYQPGDTFRSVTESTTFYAVWDKGYSDLFGGADIVYFSKGEAGVAILSRGGREFRGTVDADGVGFSFVIREGTDAVTLSGKVTGNTFAYHRENVAGTYTYFSGYLNVDEDTLKPVEGNVPVGKDADSTLVLEDPFTATLTLSQNVLPTQSGEPTVVSGTYGFDPDRELYFFESTTGARLYFILRVPAEGEEDRTPTFSLVDTTELGSYAESVWLSVDGAMSMGDFAIVLSGNGMLYLVNLYTEETYSGLYTPTYTIGSLTELGMEVDFYSAVYFAGDNEALTFEFYIFRATYEDGTSDAFLTRRIDSAVGTFEGEIDGKKATITLNGYNGIDYLAMTSDPTSPICVTIGEGETAETYDIYDADGDEGLFGDYLIRVSDAGLGTILKFQIKKDDKLTEYTVRLYEEEGAKKFEAFTDGEYYWLMYQEDEANGIEGGDYALPFLLVVSDEAYTAEGVENATKASMFFPDETRTFSKFSDGYITDDAGGLFKTYTNIGEALSEEVSFFASTFKFRLHPADESVPRDVYLVYEIDDEPLYREIEDSEGNSLLVYMNVQTLAGVGSFYIPAEGEAVEGSLVIVDETDSETGGTVTFEFTPSDADAALRYFVVTLSISGSGQDAEVTFEGFEEIEAPSAPQSTGVYYEFSPEGSFFDLPILVQNEDGSYTYNVYDRTSGALLGSVKGTSAKTGETVFGSDIYTFTPEQNSFSVTTFTYVLYETVYKDEAITLFLTAYDEPEAMESEAGDKIELDGYCFMAVLYTADGETYNGIHYYEFDNAGNPIALYFIGETGAQFVLELQADGDDITFTLLDPVYGFFMGLLTESGEIPYGEIYLELDGKGSLIIYEYPEMATQPIPVGDGTYTYGWDEDGYLYVSMTIDFGELSTHGEGTVSVTAHVATLSGYYVLVLSESRGGANSLYNEADWSVLTFGDLEEGESGAAVYYDNYGYPFEGTLEMLDATHGLFEFNEEDIAEGSAPETYFIYFSIDKAKGTFTPIHEITTETYTDDNETEAPGTILVRKVGPRIINFDINLPYFTDSEENAFVATNLSGSDLIELGDEEGVYYYELFYEGEDGRLYVIDLTMGDSKVSGGKIFSISTISVSTTFASEGEMLVIFQFWDTNDDTIVAPSGEKFEQLDLFDMAYYSEGFTDYVTVLGTAVGMENDGTGYAIYLYQGGYSFLQRQAGIVFSLEFDEDGFVSTAAYLGELKIGYAVTADGQYVFDVLYDDYYEVRYVFGAYEENNKRIPASFTHNPSGTWTVKLNPAQGESKTMTIVMTPGEEAFDAVEVSDLAEGSYTGTEGTITVTATDVQFNLTSIKDSAEHAFTFTKSRNEVVYSFLDGKEGAVYGAQFDAEDGRQYFVEFTITGSTFKLYCVSVNITADFTMDGEWGDMKLGVTQIWHEGTRGDKKGDIITAQLYQYVKKDAGTTRYLNGLVIQSDSTKHTLSYLYQDPAAYYVFELTLTVDENGMMSGVSSSKQETSYSADWQIGALPDTEGKYAVLILFEENESGYYEVKELLAFGTAQPGSAEFEQNVTIQKTPEGGYTVSIDGEQKYSVTFTGTTSGVTVTVTELGA